AARARSWARGGRRRSSADETRAPPRTTAPRARRAPAPCPGPRVGRVAAPSDAPSPSSSPPPRRRASSSAPRAPPTGSPSGPAFGSRLVPPTRRAHRGEYLLDARQHAVGEVPVDVAELGKVVRVLDVLQREPRSQAPRELEHLGPLESLHPGEHALDV